MPRIVVVDLSHHNTIPSSLKPAFQAGVRGVIHKATEGGSYRDETLDNRAYLARDAGMLFGVYHFLRPGDMKAQAKFFVDTTYEAVEEVYPYEELLFAADHEDHGVSLSSLKLFLSEVWRLSGKKPVIYSGNVLKEQLQVEDDEISQYPLWLAQYSNSPQLPAGFSKYFLWQYTDGNAGPSPKTVPGINPPVDCNDFRGTEQDLVRAWFGDNYIPSPVPPAPSPEPSIPVITMAFDSDGSIVLTVPRGTSVRIIET